jgi:hypothetical protein
MKRAIDVDIGFDAMLGHRLPDRSFTARVG